MVSQQEIDNYVETFQKTYETLFKAQKIDELIQLYHPQAAFVQAGIVGVIGQKAIQEKLEPFAQRGVVFSLTTTRNLIAGPNAEFIIHEGTYTSEALNGKVQPYLQIFKKVENGKYVIYHNEYTFN
uniref:DUF4440 domain-containing protein n=1 Tax=Panagrellus redivivus TaxID=6233 RepID=A0A7E4UQ39_PANRE